MGPSAPGPVSAKRRWPPGPGEKLAGWLQKARAEALFKLGRLEEGAAAQQEVVRIARACGDGELLARGLNGMADIHRQSGRLGEAIRLYREGIRHAEKDPDREPPTRESRRRAPPAPGARGGRDRSGARTRAAHPGRQPERESLPRATPSRPCAHAAGKLEAARTTFEEELAYEIAHEDRVNIVITRHSLGQIALEEGRHADALALFSLVNADIERLGLRVFLAEAWLTVAMGEVGRGSYEAAALAMEHAVGAADALGDPATDGYVHGFAAIVHQLRGDPDAARMAAERARARFAASDEGGAAGMDHLVACWLDGRQPAPPAGHEPPYVRIGRRLGARLIQAHT